MEILYIVLNNFGFWINIAVPFAVGFYFYFSSREYTFKEFSAQVGLTLLVITLSYYILFRTTTNLMDKEYWNSKVEKFVYYEKWTELVTYTESYSCGTSKNPKTCTRTKTRRDYHPPRYIIENTIGDTISINKNKWDLASSEYGKKFIKMYRSNKVSFGDGNRYESYPNKVIPVSTEHSYVNYILESKYNVLHKQKLKNLYKEYNIKLHPYPSFYEGKYGETKLYRVQGIGGKLGDNYLKTLDKKSVLLAFKQCNPIIVFTDKDRGFKTALESYWHGAKKNDVVLVIGKEGNRIVWSDVITYTDKTDFIVDAQNSFIDMNVSNYQKIIDKFSNLIVTEWTRKPMKDFEYMSKNVSLDWYWQLLIVLINLIGSFFLIRAFLTNYDNK